MRTRPLATLITLALFAGAASAQQSPTQPPVPQSTPLPQQPAPITTEQDWIAALRDQLQRTKTMPPQAENELAPGRYTARLSFKVARAGIISDIRIATGSGQRILDEHATSLLARISPLPPFPGAMQGPSRSFTVPYAFVIPEPVKEDAASQPNQ